MSIILPSLPGPMQADITYLDWGGVIGSPLGGADQKLNRLGDRFALSVTLPTMESHGTAREWIAKLILARKTGAIYEWPQPGFGVGAPGQPVVDGAGQAGTTLNLRAGTPRYSYRFDQHISVIHNGRRYLHMVVAPAIADENGDVSLSVAPMLRAPYADGATVEVGRPKIEGFLEGNSQDWTIDLAFHVGLSFKITEAE